ncbi:hypothetical protein FDP41_006276 [Naegleria fowleri]|uniref:MalT-like TPR region domain-containing protein n=1 Tax=Naegleria fowleri TaxID=5763 RepID=A0A6A5BIX0_NAEFO|nr:uncharacterized protein FDP41_006276 [Naegleria fowleri]KAF0974802.1 hypothetical protein FDP41_006276 [Naegleria fowleri]
MTTTQPLKTSMFLSDPIQESENGGDMGGRTKGRSGLNWLQLEQKFNDLIAQLNSPQQGNFSGTTAQQKQEYIKQLELSLEAIIEVALSESSIILQEGDYKKAIVGGLKALEYIQKLYGKDALQQVEAYFLLSKASQQMGQFKQAEEYLSIANWTCMKNKEKCSPNLRAELHQHFGLLYVQQGKVNEAVENMSASVYYLSLDHGTHDLVTSFAYFNLGNVFVSMQGKSEKGISFMKKVVDIWYDQLSAVLFKGLNKSVDGVSDVENKKKSFKTSLQDLDEDKVSDAEKMFEHILNTMLEQIGENHVETGKTYEVSGLYFVFIGDCEKGTQYLEKAQSIFSYVLGDNHQLTKEVKDILDTLSKRQE